MMNHENMQFYTISGFTGVGDYFRVLQDGEFSISGLKDIQRMIGTQIAILEGAPDEE